MGRPKAVRVCPRCKYCIDHEGCHCVPCATCKKRVPPGDVCKKCQRCREHHAEWIPDSRDFPFRNCVYKGVSAAHRCSCKDWDEYKTCSKCKKCPRHACLCESFIINPLQRSIGCELEIAEYGSFTAQSWMDIPVR